MTLSGKDVKNHADYAESRILEILTLEIPIQHLDLLQVRIRVWLSTNVLFSLIIFIVLYLLHIFFRLKGCVDKVSGCADLLSQNDRLCELSVFQESCKKLCGLCGESSQLKDTG